LAARIHSSKHLKDNSENHILGLMQQAGLVGAKKVITRTMLLGLLCIGYYIATASDLPEPQLCPRRAVIALALARFRVNTADGR
jgi:hypothetical protein